MVFRRVEEIGWEGVYGCYCGGEGLRVEDVNVLEAEEYGFFDLRNGDVWRFEGDLSFDLVGETRDGEPTVCVDDHDG